MTTFRDLQPLNYFGEEFTGVLRAVGWLGRDQDFETGRIGSEFYERLVALLARPYQPIAFAGFHECEVCQFDGVCGAANLWVPADGFIMVCPELILHYINAHYYKPPEVFQEAVMVCPDIASREYKRAFLNNGGRLITKFRYGG